MPAVVFTMLVILVVAAAVIAVVVMGMEGTGKDQHPEIANAMARTARHLNGEAEPPKGLVSFFDEVSEVPVPDLKDLKAVSGKIRSLRSARSATSASSAPSATPPAHLEPGTDGPLPAAPPAGAPDFRPPPAGPAPVDAGEGGLSAR